MESRENDKMKELTKKIAYNKTGKKAEEYNLDMDAIEKELNQSDDDEDVKLLKKIEIAEKERKARKQFSIRSSKTK